MQSNDEAPSGWMVPSLLGPYQGSRPQRSVVRRNILLVELPWARAESLATVIESRGHRVLLAQQMSEAVELVADTVPDLVVLAVSHSDPSALIRALEATYARGWRPQVVTDAAGHQDQTSERLLTLLEAH